MTLNSVQSIPLLEDVVAETTPVAVINRSPEQLQGISGLNFEEAYDDLDSVNFALLSLPINKRVCLVHHRHAPGTDICVVKNQKHTELLIQETLITLGLNLQDLSWIHPQYETALKHVASSTKL